MWGKCVKCICWNVVMEQLAKTCLTVFCDQSYVGCVRCDQAARWACEQGGVFGSARSSVSRDIIVALIVINVLIESATECECLHQIEK